VGPGVTRAIATRRTDRIATALSEARARSSSPVFVGYLELYCDGEGCSVREVVVHVAEHDRPTSPRLHCPACRRPLKLHQAQTREERLEDDEAAARVSVNVRWKRAHPGEEAVPLGLLLNDRLPDPAAVKRSRRAGERI
jgi:uncharacterized protein YbaR (Trm112 family)